MKLLFIIHVKDKFIGGSKISAIDSANKLEKFGHDVYLIADKENFTVQKLLSKKVKLIDFKHDQLWPIKKSWLLYKTIKKHKFDKIITIDRQSAYISSIFSVLKDIPLVPIIPGGGKEQLPIEPVKIPTIVFSEENKQNLMQMFDWPEGLIDVVPARIDVQKFSSNEIIEKRENSVAFISRVHETKSESFYSFIEELKNLSKSNLKKFKFDLIGDGDNFDEWKKYSKKSKVPVKFIGQKKISGKILSNYKLVVGQGRVILEAISSGTIASICGNNGYKGIIKTNNFDEYASTNFTGRDMVRKSKLDHDLNELDKNISEIDLLYRLVYDKYDIHILAKKISKHNAKVNRKILISSFYKIIKNKLRI
jgi:hypothetical protein